MLTVLILSIATLLMFLPLTVRAEVFFSADAECFYFELKFFYLRIFRRKLFLKKDGIFYFKRNKQFPAVKGKTKKKKKQSPPPADILYTIGRVSMSCEFFFSSENPFSLAIATSYIANSLAVLSAFGVKVKERIGINAGPSRVFVRLGVRINTDIVKILLSVLQILGKKLKEVKNDG